MEFAGLGYSEEQIDLLEVATGFCREKSPIASVRAHMESEPGFDPQLWQEMADLGWLAIAVPEQFGGVGLSMAEIVPVAEQMGRNMLASPFPSTSTAIQALLAGGTATQMEQWLPRLASGSIATLALYEDHGDWDLSHITATAQMDGDEFILSGKKYLVLWAVNAEIIITSLMLDGKTAFAIIPADAIPEGALQRENIIDERKRSFSLNLEGIRLPRTALMDVGKARETLYAIEMAALLLQAAENCGGTQAVIDYTIEYLTTRRQFGKVIGEYQALKHPAVDAYVDYEKARSHLYSAAHSFGEQGTGEVAVRMAKAASQKAYDFAADRAIQFHGGFGFTHDCDAGLHRRAAIFQASQFGDAAWHRQKLGQLLFA